MNYLLQTVITALLIANANEKWILTEPIIIQFSENEWDQLVILGLQVNDNMELMVLHELDGHGYDCEAWTPAMDFPDPITDVLYQEIVVKRIQSKEEAA